MPGVLLLDGVIEVAAGWLGVPLRVRGLRQAKFLQVLLPGEAATVELDLDGESLDFVIRRDDTTVARGRLVIEVPPARG